MTTPIDYALMAGVSYIDTRNIVNRFPAPDEWAMSNHKSKDSGFEAVTFTKGTDIVISYAGTYDKDFTGDVAADIALGAGLISSQLFQAAEYYMQIKADNTINGIPPNIILTGHSLGGGLASLIAVFFNETAVTFDQAPFRNSANLMVAAALKTDLTNKFPTTTYPQIAAWLDPLDKFILSFDPLGLGWSQDGLVAREAKVTTQSVQGEFLSAATALRIGSELPPLTHGDYFAPLNLHSQALLSAFLQSTQTAAAGKALSDVTFKLTDLLEMIFDENLYSKATDTDKENFLERLVRHEFGNAPDVAGVVTADAMLTRFTSDLWKIAQDGGLTLTDANLSKTLTAFAMQMYYENAAATDASKQLFNETGVSGGIHFNLDDVAATLSDTKRSKGSASHIFLRSNHASSPTH